MIAHVCHPSRNFKTRSPGEPVPRSKPRSNAARAKHVEASRRTAVVRVPADIRRRVQRVLEHTIEFVGSAACSGPGAAPPVAKINGQAKRKSPTSKAAASAQGNRTSRTSLDRMCEAPLLSADEEHDLFRRLNYVKHRAYILRESFDARRPNIELLEIIEEMLAEADELRNHLITSNLRLVISISKRFVSPHCSFDERVSEGVVTLMRAVEKFDVARGFRFSTYATHAIQRSLFRFVKQRQKESSRLVSEQRELPADATQDGIEGAISERRWEQIGRTIDQLLDRLNDREQLIIRARFGLGEQRQVETLQSLADRLGICKERVRQLEMRAVAKLQTLAEQLNLEPLPA